MFSTSVRRIKRRRVWQRPRGPELHGRTRQRAWRQVLLPLYRTPFPGSTVLTVPVPGSVAGMHRQTEMVQKAWRCIQYKHRVLYKPLRFLHNGSQVVNFNTRRKHWADTQNHKQKFGRRRNPIYSSSSTSKSPSASSAEKHGISGVSTLCTQQVPSFKQELFRCMG